MWYFRYEVLKFSAFVLAHPINNQYQNNPRFEDGSDLFGYRSQSAFLNDIELSVRSLKLKVHPSAYHITCPTTISWKWYPRRWTNTHLTGEDWPRWTASECWRWWRTERWVATPCYGLACRPSASGLSSCRTRPARLCSAAPSRAEAAVRSSSTGTAKYATPITTRSSD